MTNSESSFDPSGWVTDLLAFLDEAAVAEAVDVPIEDAVATFEVPRTETIDQKILLDATGSFITHLYPSPTRPSEQEAKAEALHLLERAYDNGAARGWDAAYADALDPGADGIRLVVASLQEIVCARERRRYVTRVLHETIGPLEWRDGVRVAAYLHEELYAVLPQHLRDRDPSLLTDDLVAWLELYRIAHLHPSGG